MRSTEQRKSDAIAKLEEDLDVWVATANDRQVAHLVPLSLCWHGEEVIVTTKARSRTARNVMASGQARLMLGSSRDVVMIDAAVTVVECTAIDPAILAAFRDRNGWDPSDEDGEWVYLRFNLREVQVWRDVEEITGRTVMRNGAWLA